MNKLLETLQKMLPEEQFNEMAAAVEEMLNESKSEMKKEAEVELEKAYEAVAVEVAESERVAVQGYQEAYAIIVDQENRKEAMREEFERMLEEQYEEAWKMIKEEQGKNNDLESTMYDEYDNKLNEMKSYIVDKVDEFLQFKGKEIYEQAKRDILNDPRMAEHKVVLDRVVSDISDYLTEEELQLGTSRKLEDVQKKLEKLQSELKRQEGRNIRLSTENTQMGQKLEEAVKIIQENEAFESETALTEQNERANRAGTVQGRGHSVTDEKLIAEYHNDDAPAATQGEEPATLMENLDDIKRLAGYK
jgi:hypothetical protein